MVKKTFSIKGMHCNSCAVLIEKELKDKVNSISVDYAREKAEVDFDENKISAEDIKEIIEKLEYECEDCCESKEQSRESLVGRRKELKEMFLREEISSADYEKQKEELESELIRFDEKMEKEKIEKDKENNKGNKNEELKGDNKDLSNKIGWFVLTGSAILLIIVLYYFFGSSIKIPYIKVPNGGESASLLLLFVAGILTGFHCIAMCGGFVVSYTAKNALKGHKSFKQHLVYGGGKLISYTIIGGIFGLIGGIVAFSIGLRAWVAIIAGLFMITYALGMMGIKSFRMFQFKGKFLTDAASKMQARTSGAYKGPFVTGLLNGLFIACGPLQAMYLYAAGSGSALSGASGLFAFGLGTLPIMLGFGFLATTISHKTTGKILKVSAIIVLILGLIMLNRGLTLNGSSFSYDAVKQKIIGTDLSQASTASIDNGVQIIKMNVDASGYSPNSFVLKKGVPVKWEVNVKQLTGCNSELIANQYNINAQLKQGLNTFEFTPDKTGTFSFTCGMGMLRGSFIVTETGTASQQEIKQATPAKGMQCGGSSGGGCGCGG